MWLLTLLFQRDGPSGNWYMTLQRRKVDQEYDVFHQIEPRPKVALPDGWRLAEGDADDVRVCGSHAWSSHYLVCRNRAAYGTLCNPLPSRIGECFPCGLMSRLGCNAFVSHLY